MFQIKMKTFYKDGREVETVATAEHFVAAEDEFGLSVNEMISSNKLKYFYYFAWLTSGTDADYKDWLGTILDVDQQKPEPIAPFPPATPSGGG